MFLVVWYLSVCLVAALPPQYLSPGTVDKTFPHGGERLLLNSDVTILTHNDLYGDDSPRQNAALVLSTSMNYNHARQACIQLGEALWQPSGVSSRFLEYLSFEGHDSAYWIQGSTNLNKGRTITANGTYGSDLRSHRLPVLCTQSAPLSSATYVDTQERWQTTVQAGALSVTGFRDKYSFRFEGIRYAAQPERFTYSTVYHGTGHANALAFGNQCVQGDSGSEDCLFLNIWTPFLPGNVKDRQGMKLKPIMVWVHGGGFTSGSSSDPTFDGGSLVSRGDVVVVTINYRLGTLGFLALDDGVTNGNFGLADQITALEWIRKHISAFGGDPSRITIFGQSAGAASVRALLASPKAIGKFSAAIMQSNLAGSNYATTYSEYYTIAQEVVVAAAPILESTGCTNASSQLTCLRAIDAYSLATLSYTARYLVVDGEYLISDQLEISGAGPVAHVPVMLGTMRDDGAAFIGFPQPDDTLTSFLQSQGFDSPSIAGSLNLFPQPQAANRTLDIFNTTALISTDAQFRCLDEATAYSSALHDTFASTYYYEFNRSYQLSFYSPNFPVCEAPATAEHPYGDPDLEYFKCHSGDLYYVFGNIVFNRLPLRDDTDIPFSQFVVDSWTAFARTYNPTPDLRFLDARGFINTTRAVQESGSWQAVTATAPTLRHLQWPSMQTSFGHRAQCDALGFPLNYYEPST